MEFWFIQDETRKEERDYVKRRGSIGFAMAWIKRGNHGRERYGWHEMKRKK